MLATPERRRQRLAAIREKVDRLAPTIEVDAPTGEGYLVAVNPDGTHRAPTPAERAAHENAEPRQRWAFAVEKVDGLMIAHPVAAPIARTGTREHRSPSTTRTTSRRARPSASSADPSSSRGRLSADALGALRIETTRLGLRLALLGIGGAR